MAEEEYKDFTSQEQIEEMQDNYKIDDYFPRIRGNDIKWHHILMLIGGILMAWSILDRLESITWDTNPEFYIGFLMSAIGFLGYYFRKG